MEEPTILYLNLRHYTRLLEIESDPEKRIVITALMDEIKAELKRQHAVSASGMSKSDH